MEDFDVKQAFFDLEIQFKTLAADHTVQLKAQDKIIADMSRQRDNLQVQADGMKARIDSQDETIANISAENSRLNVEVTHLKTVLNRQATYMANLDVELDELGQYGRRENVMFSNLHTDASHSPESQVIQLCKSLDVQIDPHDIVACHTLPSSNSSAPKRVIARFHDRNVASKIFKNRKHAKKIPAEVKAKIAANKDKGFGIGPNLTAKRGKLFAQVKPFNDAYGHEGCWVDPNNGKLLIRLKGAYRGRVIKSTGDLVEINNIFVPNEWYFCAPPSFIGHSDSTTPPTVSPNNQSIFSPSTPVRPYTQNFPRHRGGNVSPANFINQHDSQRPRPTNRFSM